MDKQKRKKKTEKLKAATIFDDLIQSNASQLKDQVFDKTQPKNALFFVSNITEHV